MRHGGYASQQIDAFCSKGTVSGSYLIAPRCVEAAMDEQQGRPGAVLQSALMFSRHVLPSVK